MIFPGLALLLTVLAFNLVGDGMQDALNPKGTRPRRSDDGRLYRPATGLGRVPALRHHLITFVIFSVLPAGDPAVARAGRRPYPELVA